MKNQTSPSAKNFKIKFSPAIIALAIAVLALSALGIALSIARIVKFGIHGFTDIVKYPFLIAVALACIVIVVALLIKSEYIVDDKYFTSKYGVIKSRFAIKDVTAVVLDTDTYKLTVKFGEEFCVLSLLKEWNEELVRAMLAVNPNIDYSFTFAENNGKKQ